MRRGPSPRPGPAPVTELLAPPTAAWFAGYETCSTHLGWTQTFGGPDLWRVLPDVSVGGRWVGAAPLAASSCPSCIVTPAGQVVHFSSQLVRISGLRNAEWRAEPQVWGFECSGTTSDIARLGADLARVATGSPLAALTRDGESAARGETISRLQLGVDRARQAMRRGLSIRVARASGPDGVQGKPLSGLNGLSNLVPIPLRWSDRLLSTAEMAWSAMDALRRPIGAGVVPDDGTGARGAPASARVTVFPFTKHLNDYTDCRISISALRPTDPDLRRGPMGGVLFHVAYLPHQFAPFAADPPSAAALPTPSRSSPSTMPPASAASPREPPFFPAPVDASAVDAGAVVEAARAAAADALVGEGLAPPSDLRDLLGAPHTLRLPPSLARTPVAAPFIAGLLSPRPLGTLPEEMARMRAAAEAFAMGAVDPGMIPLPTPPPDVEAPADLAIWTERTTVAMCARKILWKIVAPEALPRGLSRVALGRLLQPLAPASPQALMILNDTTRGADLAEEVDAAGGESPLLFSHPAFPDQAGKSAPAQSPLAGTGFGRFTGGSDFSPLGEPASSDDTSAFDSTPLSPLSAW